MPRTQKILTISASVLAAVLLILLSICWMLNNIRFGFSRTVSPEEQALRLQVVTEAESWLGCSERSGSHKPIIDIYNSHEPLAVGYVVQYTDEWCATFGSTVAIRCGLTDIIPTECGCQRQIDLFDAIDCWEESDDYLPLPGDFIFYSLGNTDSGDCVSHSDHVGIVVGTWNGYIKVIEGNFAGTVAYRVIRTDDPTIRGFGIPDYGSLT